MATVHLPDDLIAAAKLNRENLSQSAASLIALELLREGSVSLDRAAELCETPVAAFMDFAAEHQVAPLRFDLEELEHDRRVLQNLRS